MDNTALKHEPGCCYPVFRHPDSCTCPGSGTRRLLDLGQESPNYDSKLGAAAEAAGARWRMRQGLRVQRTREVLARWPETSALANATIGDSLVLDAEGHPWADEVKEITSTGQRTGNVLISEYSFRSGHFDRLLAVDPDRMRVYELSMAELRSAPLETWTDPKDGKVKMKVPFGLGRCYPLTEEDVREEEG